MSRERCKTLCENVDAFYMDQPDKKLYVKYEFVIFSDILDLNVFNLNVTIHAW